MKTNRIKAYLAREVDKWLMSLPEDLRKQIQGDVIVTGGAIASLLLGEKPNDLDIYLRTRGSAHALAEHYVRLFKNAPPVRYLGTGQLQGLQVLAEGDRIRIVVASAGVAGEEGTGSYQYFEQVADDSLAGGYCDQLAESVQASHKKPDKDLPPYRPIFLSSNAVTLSDGVQIIFRFYGHAHLLHENFDFVHCTGYWEVAQYPGSAHFYVPVKALHSLLGKYLLYKGGSKYPLCSFIRTRKFLRRGWTIDAGQYAKMAWDLHLLDLSDPQVLEDQLIGVDAAYFHEVIQALKKHDATKIDGAYLMQVIDRIF